MGEYADMAMDMAFAEFEYQDRYPEEFDDGPDGMIIPMERRHRIKTCWFCGLGGLTWSHGDQGWHLVETETGTAHVCSDHPKIETLREVRNG